MDERREHDRVEATITAMVLVRHNAGAEFLIESISVGGARLIGPVTLAVGEHVQLLFELEGTPIEVEGVVVRADRQDTMNDRVAVTFKNLSTATQGLLHQLVVKALDLQSERPQS